MQIAVFGGTLLFFVLWQTAAAGPPEKPGNPGVPGLLAEISELNDIVATQQENIDQQLARIEELEDMLNQLQNFAPVARTGETTFYGTEIDLQTGIPWPNPRFTDNEDGTVTDNLTGIIWLKDADHFGQKNWIQAVDSCNSLEDNGIDLTDGSVQGDWRLPSIKELLSLIDYRFRNPVLPNTNGDGQWTEGDPFSNVPLTYVHGRYWSSTFCQRGGGTPLKRIISFFEGFTGESPYLEPGFRVWCARGDN